MVRLFFWQSDDAYQSSMEGLWRSILFQIFSQCPELISEVLAHQQIDSKGMSDAAEFQLPELKEAFLRLSKLSYPGRYRFACFIDGLDEHKGDNLSHQNLANMLTTWASSANVKIVCSARPYTVFIDTFKEIGIIVEFHALTRSDISRFAETKFKESLDRPNMLSAQHTCSTLIDEITTRAEGVFLWASMAVRALINQALDHDDDEQELRRRLRECPDDLEALFQKMLSRVDGASRIQMRSNMVLYLAVHNPFESPLNMLAYSWLDELEWFGGTSTRFLEPKSSRLEPLLESVEHTFSPEQMMIRRERVQSLLHQVTQGLLEVVADDNPWRFFLKYRVDLYHRSVRDFLKDQWSLGIRKSPFTSEEKEVEAYSFLRSLEARGLTRVWHRTQRDDGSYGQGRARAEDALGEAFTLELRSLFEYTFIWLAACARKGKTSTIACLRDFESTLEEAQQHGIMQPFLLGLMLVNGQVSWRYHSRNALDSASFLHWAAYWNQGHFVRARLEDLATATKSESMKPALKSPDLSLLLSSSVAADVDTTRYLLQHKHNNPNDPIQLTDHNLDANKDDMEIRLHQYARVQRNGMQWAHLRMDEQSTTTAPAGTTTVWLVFLRDLANNIRSYCWKRIQAASWPLHLDRDWLERLACVVEEHLRAGANPAVFFVVVFAASDNEEALWRLQKYRISLLQILDVFKPENMEALKELSMLERKSWRWDLSIGSLLRSRTPSPVGEDQSASVDMLLNEEWRVLGVLSESGEELMGSFKVRVF